IIESYIMLVSIKRRHTRSKRDWSSDVCSSDLSLPDLLGKQPLQSALAPQQANGEFAVVTSTVQLLLHPFRVKRVRLAAPSSIVIQAFVKLAPVQLPRT